MRSIVRVPVVLPALPDPEIIAQEIVDDLTTALEQFATMIVELLA